MGTMPDHIVKPPFLKRLDKASKVYLQTGQPDLDILIADLQTKNLVDIGINYGWVSTMATPGQMSEEHHLRRHWLNDPPGSGWWPQIANIADILRQSYITAVNLLRAVRKPIDAYWVCHGAQNAGSVQVDALVSSNQITLLIGTPMPPVYAAPPAIDDLSAWTTYFDAASRTIVSRPIRVVTGDFLPEDEEAEYAGKGS